MKQLVFNGALNRDLAPKFLKQEDYVGAKNIIFQTSKDGNSGILRLYPGFVEATGPEIPAGSVEMGTLENKTKREVYFLLYDPAGQDRICKYMSITNTYENVFIWSGLNFSPSFKITGIAMIGNLLFWTDKLNQPRGINVTRTYTNIVEDDITIIKPAPLFPLDYELELTATDYSVLTNNAYQFSYRYVYLDNQISVIAPYTQGIFCEDDANLVTSIRLNKSPNEEIPKYVKEVQLLVRRHDIDNWQIWQTVTSGEFAGNVAVEILATQLAVPYVDSNTLIQIDGEVAVWEFFEGSLIGPNYYAAGTNINVRNYNIEVGDPLATTPELRIDIYRNGVLWQQISKEIVLTGESISFNFLTEAGVSYQIYSYSTEDGVPDASPFTNIVKGFQFSGDRLGRAIPAQETVTPFESVPLKSKSLEVARDRISLAWNTEGYDRIDIPSLRVDLEELSVDIGDKSLNVWKQTDVFYEEDYSIEVYTVTFSSTTVTYWLKDEGKFYFFKTGGYSSASFPGGPGSIPGEYTGIETIFTVNQLEFKTEADLVFDTTEGSIGIGDRYSTSSSILEIVDPAHIITTSVNTPDTVGNTKFKNKSQYQIGIVFYDRYSRNSGTYTNKNCIATINDDFRAGTINAMKWSISTVDEQYIPIWADSYQIVRTDNLSRVTFLQGKTSDIYWAYFDADVLKYSREYRADAEYLEIDISGSFKSGVRYNFTQGDLIDLEVTTGIKTFAIIGFLGSKVRIAPISEDEFETTISPFPVRVFYEIWTRKDIVSDLIFREVSEVFPIINKRTVDRAFSSIVGYLKGDVIVITDQTFDYLDTRTLTGGAFTDNALDPTPIDIVVEAINIDNNLDVGWIKDLGRFNAELGIDQVEKETAIRWSNRFIQGTKVNGTSNFSANDEKQLPIEVGPIYKLQLTSKQQQEGTVMLALCDPECVSLYLGETQFVDQVNREIVGATVEIIGSTNVLTGGAGTINPESVIYHNGRVWWWDFYNSRVLRYDPNGIRDISELGMKSYFYGKSVPVTGYDPFHNLFMIGFGGDMLSFDENNNQWRSEYEFSPGLCSKTEDFLIAFKNGTPYRSNGDSLATYFDTQKQGIYEFYLSDSTPQILDNICMFVTEVFTWASAKQIVADLFEITVTNESGQETNLLYSDFEVNESVLYAHFFRDKNSSGGLLNGEVMRSDIHKVKITIKGNIGFETLIVNDSKSSGH